MTYVRDPRMASYMPPEGADLRFARNNNTGRVHVCRHHPRPGDEGYERQRTLSFMDGLIAAGTTPVTMLCGQRLRIAMAGSVTPSPPGDFINAFADDDLCIVCIRVLGDQSWRAFHVDNRGRPGD